MRFALFALAGALAWVGSVSAAPNPLAVARAPVVQAEHAGHVGPNKDMLGPAWKRETTVVNAMEGPGWRAKTPQQDMQAGAWKRDVEVESIERAVKDEQPSTDDVFTPWQPPRKRRLESDN